MPGRAKPPKPAAPPITKIAEDDTRPSNAFLEVAGPKPGLKSTELWMALTGAGAITQIAMSDIDGFGPTWQQALCCLAIAITIGSYSIGRGIAKRGAPPR